MSEAELIEKLRNSTFESIDLLSENHKILGIHATDIYEGFMIAADKGKLSASLYLSELNIVLCNNSLSVNIYDTFYNIFLCLTSSMISYREFKERQLIKESKKRKPMNKV